MELTQADVRMFFKYDRKTGALVRRFKCGKAGAGTSSNCKDRDGYLVVGIGGKMYRAHRVVWLYVKGEWPLGDLDHKNRIKHDNRIRNLREVTKSQNKQNQLAAKTNKSGFKGVYWCDQSQKWRAEICHLGVKRVAEFETVLEAAKAYSKAARHLHTYNPAATKLRVST